MDRLAAAVYLAEDLKHQRKVAVKVLQPELAAVIGAERFLSEIKTTANLQHPHILPLFDSGSADGLLFYVMPYVDGETLRSRLVRETQLSVSEAVRHATEVAGALDYAHSHGVIHRDIKPEKKAAAYRMSSRSINAAEHHRSPGRARGSRDAIDGTHS